MRDLYQGIGQAVGERTILRHKDGDEFETWGDVSNRVVLGNVLLDPVCGDADMLYDYTSNGKLLWSGRHLQHGDETQPYRNMEVFTNCATAATCTLSFGLLLQGSGVGRCYDDDMMLVDWDYAPRLYIALHEDHPDIEDSEGLVDYIYGGECSDRQEIDDEYIVWHTVEDSREGWMKALEIYETMTFNRDNSRSLILDFSLVRSKGSPINGMQGRPSCGPVPTIRAFTNVADNVVGNGHRPWFQNMLVDHYFAESVQVGGARRSARIAVKNWRDDGILDFIRCKSDHDLWTANHSVGVDDKFWDEVHSECTKVHDEYHSADDVFDAVTYEAYHSGKGEPGFLNLHLLNNNEDGLDWEELYKGEWAGSSKYVFNNSTKEFHGALARAVHKKEYKFIVNPCAEITLFILGGFCVIGDIVPYHCSSLNDIRNAGILMTRALIRVNLMDNMYNTEVTRTNRIGVSLTGIHEWLWDSFQCTFDDIVTDKEISAEVGQELEYVRKYIEEEAKEYSRELGLNVPHTFTTIKPAGTTSKLFGLTEGCHLPSMSTYLRWVQFRKDDPLVTDYNNNGYPIKHLESRNDITLVGFPTRLPFGSMDIGDKIVYAGDASMDDQFEWLRWLERYWIGDSGNQISYTLKYNPNIVGYDEFRKTLKKNMNTVCCVSVMPQIDATAYEYQPEEQITNEEYEFLIGRIYSMKEDISSGHIECSTGGCPIDFKERKLND